MLYAHNYQDKFIIQTDESGEGISVVLALRSKDEEYPFRYFSRKFTETEKKNLHCQKRIRCYYIRHTEIKMLHSRARNCD